MGTKFQVHYVITNGGDGSASVRFCRTGQLAEIYDDFLQTTQDGWGEGESFTDDLEFDKEGFVVDALNEAELIQQIENQIHIEMKAKKPNITLIKSCKQWLKDLQAV